MPMLDYGANAGRDRITQALMNVQNPPPRQEVPTPQPMPLQGAQGLPGQPPTPPGTTPSQMAAGAMPPPPQVPPTQPMMGGMFGGAGNMQPGAVMPAGVAPPAPNLGQMPPQVQQQLAQQQLPPNQQLPMGGPTGY